MLVKKREPKWSFQRAEVSGLANRNIAVYPHLTLVRQPKSQTSTWL